VELTFPAILNKVIPGALPLPLARPDYFGSCCPIQIAHRLSMAAFAPFPPRKLLRHIMCVAGMKRLQGQKIGQWKLKIFPCLAKKCFQNYGGIFMGLVDSLVRILVQQVANEYRSAYLYLGMAAYFEKTPFAGFARWMRWQAREEMQHGRRIYEYLAARGAAIELKTIEAVPCNYDSPLAAFRAALDHEKLVSRWIRDCYELALLEKDYETVEFLNWFLREQVEEEEQAQLWVDRLEFAGEQKSALLSIDGEAGKRGESDD
jgi:ferritin